MKKYWSDNLIKIQLPWSLALQIIWYPVLQIRCDIYNAIYINGDQLLCEIDWNALAKLRWTTYIIFPLSIDSGWSKRQYLWSNGFFCAMLIKRVISIMIAKQIAANLWLQYSNTKVIKLKSWILGYKYFFFMNGN